MMKLKCLITYTISDDDVQTSFESLLESIGMANAHDPNIYCMPFTARISLGEIKEKISNWEIYEELGTQDMIQLYSPCFSPYDDSEIRIMRSRFLYNEEKMTFEWD